MKKEITIDDLALMIAKGFNNTDTKFKELKSEIAETKNELKAEIKELKLDIREIKTNLNKKVDKIDHNTLAYRVEKLEKKFAA